MIHFLSAVRENSYPTPRTGTNKQQLGHANVRNRYIDLRHRALLNYWLQRLRKTQRKAILIGKDQVAAAKEREEIKDERATNHE